MLFGVLYHAMPLGHDRPLFTVVDYLSSHFRMGGFFAISGFLTGVIASRRDRHAWIQKRLARLIPPLVTGILITVPSMALLARGAGQGFALTGPTLFQWFHLWFLLALIVYLPVASWLAFGPACDRFCEIFIRLGRAAGSLQLAVISALSLACFALLTIGAELTAAIPYADATVLKTLPLILCYAPIYALGILFGRNQAFCKECLAPRWSLCGAILVLVAVDLILGRLAAFDGSPARIVIDGFARAALPLAGSFLILRSAIGMREVPGWVARLSEASMTIYIVHLPLVVALQHFTRELQLDPYSRYAFVVLTAGLLSFAFHNLAVRRSATLRLLFNGQIRNVGALAARPSHTA